MLRLSLLRPFVPGFAALALVSGCASLSESQCIASDWETVGYRDGSAGKQSSQLLAHQDACVKHGVIPDREPYLTGWNDGVRQFCLAENGFSVGESGNRFSNVCPEDMQAGYYSAYQEGRQLYLARAEIETLNRQIAQKEYRIKQLSAELTSTESHLIESETTAAERRELLDRTRVLAEEQGKLDAEIQDLRVNVALKSERLKHLQQTLAYAF